MKNVIGIFDSGVGGLSVLKYIKELFTNEKIIYFGDTARVPYGSKNSNTILKYSMQSIEFLKSQNANFIIAACGTISSTFINNNIDNEYFKEVYYSGIIEPTTKKAIKKTRNGNIGVIATKATVDSNVYKRYIKNIDNTLNIVSLACPLFVPMVEEGIINKNHDVVKSVLKFYLDKIKEFNIDTLILGCTHYSLLISAIKEYMGNNVKIIDPGIETALYIKEQITGFEDEFIETEINNYDTKFFITGDKKKFSECAKSFLNQDISKNLKVISLSSIEEYSYLM